MVLERPEIPLHTNGSENDIRCQVTRRKVSAGTRSDAGAIAAMLSSGLPRHAQSTVWRSGTISEAGCTSPAGLSSRRFRSWSAAVGSRPETAAARGFAGITGGRAVSAVSPCRNATFGSAGAYSVSATSNASAMVLWISRGATQSPTRSMRTLSKPSAAFSVRNRSSRERLPITATTQSTSSIHSSSLGSRSTCPSQPHPGAEHLGELHAPLARFPGRACRCGGECA